MYISTRSPKKSLISLTSLIDVVFILLIFFMLSSSFIQWNYITLGTGQSDEETSADNPQSLIRISENREYRLKKEITPLDTIIERVAQQIARNKNHVILVQADNEVVLQELVIVLDSLGKIAATNIALVKEEQ
jgi:biopolymer transport protein ExbD